MAQLSPTYSELKGDASSSLSLLSEHEGGTYDREPLVHTRPQWTTARWITVLITSIIFTNVTSILITYKTLLSPNHQKSVFEPPTGIPSSLSNISLETTPQRTLASFYDRDDSLYRKHGSPETEAAWRELTQRDAGLLLLSKTEGEKVGIDPKMHAYWDNPEEGLVGYPVRLEATHQLHCLNLLRRFSYFHYNYTLEYDAEPLKEVPFHYRRLHLDHCVDYLRQRLMCFSDMNILPYVWYRDNDQAVRDSHVVGDMSRTYTCRNYESMRSFIKEKAQVGDGRVQPKPGDNVLDDYI